MSPGHIIVTIIALLPPWSDDDEIARSQEQRKKARKHSVVSVKTEDVVTKARGEDTRTKADIYIKTSVIRRLYDGDERAQRAITEHLPVR